MPNSVSSAQRQYVLKKRRDGLLSNIRSHDPMSDLPAFNVQRARLRWQGSTMIDNNSEGLIKFAAAVGRM